ncbi:MAG TPA: nuclear transport factor 2 family protein [Burkholderiaceae bacterium]|nr:nuclear transport factor 2 family protein [Burkholderiaceae bacterium]
MLSREKRFEIEAECKRVALCASNFADAGRLQEYGDCHTDDAEFIRPSTYPANPLKGRAELVSSLKSRDENLLSRHVLSNMIVDVINDHEAQAIAYFLHYAARRNVDDPEAVPAVDSALKSVGEYQIRFVLQQGKWRIQRRVGRFLFGGVFKP